MPSGALLISRYPDNLDLPGGGVQTLLPLAGGLQFLGGPALPPELLPTDHRETPAVPQFRGMVGEGCWPGSPPTLHPQAALLPGCSAGRESWSQPPGLWASCCSWALARRRPHLAVVAHV